MQQNVQSQRHMEGLNYSQQRNSIPSKMPVSDKVPNHQQIIPISINPKQLQFDQNDKSSNHNTVDKLKLIDEEIQKEKQLIQRLRIQNQLQKQQLQHTLNKSYLSLNPNQFVNLAYDQAEYSRDELYETQTQADFSVLEGRKNIAIKQIETEEEKYKQNIRKMQLRKFEIKKKQMQDKQIPIKIMDFKDLEKKKETKQDVVSHSQNKIQPQLEKSINKKQSSKRSNIQKSGKEMVKSEKQMTNKSSQKLIEQDAEENQLPVPLLIIETQSRRKKSIKPDQVEEKKSNKSSTIKEKVQSEKQVPQNKYLSQKNSKISSQHKTNSKAEEDIAIENKSRVSGKSSNKKYSVKMSSVVVPQINESIKEIQQRKSQRRYQNQPSVKGSVSSQINHNLEEASQKSRSRVSSVKNQIAKSQHSQKTDQEEQKQIENLENKSLKESIKSKSSHQQSQSKSQNVKEKSVHSFISQNNVQEKRQTLSVKQKSVSIRSKSNSKKSQKIELMYIPHAAKQPSHKSFKKTDKSIQWSQVDISMYGRTNQVMVSQNESRIVNQLNQQSLVLAVQSNVINQIGTNKINMRKNKQNDNYFFEQSSQKSKKSMNLEPLQPIKEKSLRESAQSRLNKSRTSIAASRQGSVNEKVDRYDRFHRQHSLKNQKVQSKKIAILQDLNKLPSSKPASYRSRKSNPVSNSSVSKSKVQSVAKNDNKVQQKESSFELIKNSSRVNDSRVLISKEEISLLYGHIKRLQEKLLLIEQKQQKLARDKTQQLQRLQQLTIEEQRVAEETLKNSLLIQNNQTLVIQDVQNLAEGNQNIKGQQLQIHEIETESKEIVEVQNKDEPTAEINVEETKSIQQEQPIQQQQEQQNVQCEAQQINNQIIIQNIQTPKEQQHTHQITSPEQQNKLQNSFVSQKQTIQQEIIQIASIQAKFTNEKEELLHQINRLKKVIREMQIEKIKSIDHQNTINSNAEVKPQRPDTQYNQIGVIVHQNKKNQTLDPIKIDLNKSLQSQNQDIIPFGKIVRNSLDKNLSKVLQNFDNQTKSNQKKFRINVSKKTSILSDTNTQRNLDSAELLFIDKKTSAFDEDGNDLLLKKKKESYPINQKQGYIVISNEKQSTENIMQKVQQSQLPSNQDTQNIVDQKTRKSELTKEQILERFHRTNQQFNNFVQSSRVINETNSSMSSQNNFFFDKTHRSGSIVIGENKSNQQEDNNPQNRKLLNKLSQSNLQLPQNDFKQNTQQQSFTRIVNYISNQTQDDQEDEEIPEIEVGNILMPNLLSTPDISLDQDQLMQLAKQTFKLFDIEVNSDDTDFNMKKYKNCVIFTKATETILWHYNGKFYLGGWKGKQDGSGQKTGYGIEIVPDKHIYKGQFMNGKKHGTGIIKTTNGNFYDGQWIEGIKNGQGLYYDSTTKVVYQGEWKDGKKNGFGVLKFSQKEYYKGTFVKSVKDGYGIEVFVNGDKYRGQYRKGKFHGKGKYTWANTSAFEGDFYEGMRHGHGTWKSAKVDADVYVGTYENDKKSGYGRYVWSNGCIYEGNFAQDVKHGKGRLIYTDGRQIRGVWQEGSLLEAVTENPKEYHQEDVLKRSRKIKIK